MKALFLSPLVVAVCLLAGSMAQAQYKGPRDYFPKSYPAPAPGGQPASPKTPGNQTPSTPATPSAPATPQQPKFKDLAVNSQFYFLSDTNRAFAWTKISATTAKNSKNGITQAINVETPVQK